MIVSRYGENAIRVQFGTTIDTASHVRVLQLYHYIRGLHRDDIVDITPSFNACLIHFDGSKTAYPSLTEMLAGKEAEMGSVVIPEPATHNIPVRYGGKEGPDMPAVCAQTGLSEEEVVAIHQSLLYHVFTVGFIPGFAYLGILDKRLNVPRLATPRIKVPQGSVGIAQLQTGIYPFDSPAGWRIIGKTDVRLFDHEKSPFSLMQIGDRVRFTGI
jgi:KipI family sensor histidine kinase inhibitor